MWKKRYKKKIVKKQKTKTIVAKYCSDRGEISLSRKQKENYNSKTIDNTDLDQAKDKCQVLTCNGGEVTSNKGIKLKAVLCSNSASICFFASTLYLYYYQIFKQYKHTTCTFANKSTVICFCRVNFARYCRNSHYSWL